MRNIIIVLAIIFIVIISSIYGMYINARSEKREIEKYNLEYETFLNKTMLGTEVVTVINKATDQNERNKIQKDEKNYYIENNENSIKVYLKMITIDRTYPMEEFYNNDITVFVQNFNLVEFKCKEIKYHQKTGLVKEMVFEQLEK